MQNVVKLFPIQRKNPITGGVAWYAQKARYDTLSHRELVDAMARNTGIPRGKVAMAVDAIVKQIVNFLLNGHSVSISELGTFTPRVKSKGVTSEDLVTSDNIKSLLFKFRPITPLRVDMQENAQFEVGEYEPSPGPQPSPVVPMEPTQCFAATDMTDPSQVVQVSLGPTATSANINLEGAPAYAIILNGQGLPGDCWATLDPTMLSKRDGTPIVRNNLPDDQGYSLEAIWGIPVYGSGNAEKPTKIYFVSKNNKGKNAVFFTFNLI